jgi:hypothetical protein
MIPSDHDIASGHDLYAALKKLAFDPEVLCWVAIEGETELAMVTSLADRIGSLAIYEALHRAQDWGMIPAGFDLMRLSVYSPHSELGEDLNRLLAKTVDSAGSVAGIDKIGRTMLQVGVFDPWYIYGPGIYVIRKAGYSASADISRWRKIERRIAQNAA